MGRAADNGDRKNIITAGCLIWNLALMVLARVRTHMLCYNPSKHTISALIVPPNTKIVQGMGMSNSFVELLAFRLILGFGQVRVLGGTGRTGGVFWLLFRQLVIANLLPGRGACVHSCTNTRDL